jgi:hypothetical protein
VLQNYQLTTELEYQSKQTEKLFFKNQKLSEQVKALRRDVEIHKQVEGELAKRSHFCQKLIKKLRKRIRTVEEECQELVAETENSRANAKAKDEGNEMKEKRLRIMEEDLANFELKLTMARNVEVAVTVGLRHGRGREHPQEGQAHGRPAAAEDCSVHAGQTAGAGCGAGGRGTARGARQPAGARQEAA